MGGLGVREKGSSGVQVNNATGGVVGKWRQLLGLRRKGCHKKSQKNFKLRPGFDRENTKWWVLFDVQGPGEALKCMHTWG